MSHALPRCGTDFDASEFITFEAKLVVAQHATFPLKGLAPVSIAHELSSEIAIAILTRREQTADLSDLKEIVLRVHNTLQNLTSQDRPARVVAEVFKFESSLKL